MQSAGAVLLHPSYCQTITSSLLEGKYACPGREVIFTCATNGSSVLAWSSDEYIGRNGRQLEITTSVGHRVTSMVNSNTFAELTMKEGNRSRVTESQLHITVSHDIAIASVTCGDVSSGLSSSVQFELLCKYLVIIFTSRTCTGVKQSVGLSVVVIVTTKIARSRHLGT